MLVQSRAGLKPLQDLSGVWLELPNFSSGLPQVSDNPLGSTRHGIRAAYGDGSSSRVVTPAPVRKACTAGRGGGGGGSSATEDHDSVGVARCEGL